MLDISLYQGDCLDVLKTLPDASVDAVVTDPPYGLSFMGKKWDYDIPSGEVWAECLRVLKPGGHLLAFAGTRTQHRMAVRIEDAGFEIRDMIAWVYGSGFPKSLDVSKAIDKAAGAVREVVVLRKLSGKARILSGANFNGSYADEYRGSLKDYKDFYEETAPATDAAKQWQGWGTALKPSLEPVTVARKPLVGTVAANVLAHGTGAINVDASRVRMEDHERDAHAYKRLSFLGSSSCILGSSREQFLDSLQRICAALRSYSTGGIARLHNVLDLDGTLLDHVLCEQLVARLFPNGAWCGGSSWSVPDFLCGCHSCRHSCDEHIRLLREAAQDGPPSLADALERICSGQLAPERIHACRCIDRLSSSDDFLLALSLSFLVGEYCTLYSHDPQKGRWPANLIHDGSDEPAALLGDAARFFYCPKASQADRDEGLEGFQIRQTTGGGGGIGDYLSDVDSASGKFSSEKAPAKNHHPTVKPTDLMRYLCRLVTPPGGVVLDPFMGSGSTGKAAYLEGFKFIGIERDPDYLQLAKKRINHVAKQVKLF